MSLLRLDAPPAEASSDRSWGSRLKGMSAGRKLALLGLLCFVASAGVVGLYWSRPEMKPLVSGINEEQASQVVHKLEELKVSYQLADGGTVLVPASELKRLRLEMASTGLPDDGEVGFSLFDRVNLQMSEFTEKVNYLRALQGELAETIRVLPGVAKVRVHLNLPEDSLLVEHKAPPTASVLIQLKPGARLSRNQCRGILRLVASSVEGMKTEDVTLADSAGNLLFRGEEELSEDGDHLEEKLAHILQAAAQNVLDSVVGRGRGVVSVRVELNKSLQRKIERTVLEPSKEGDGFEKSRKVTSEEYLGTYKASPPTANSTNQASATNSTAGNVVMQSEGGAGQRPSYKQSLQQVEFEYSRRVESQEESPNRIRRITASVVVDSGLKLESAALDSLKRAVSLAIGIDTARGDEFSLSALPFAKIPALAAEKGEPAARAVPVWAWGLGAGLGLALLAVGLVLKRRSSAATAMSDLGPPGSVGGELAALGTLVDIALPAEPGQEPVGAGEAKDLLKRARALAKERPDVIARVIKNWVSSERAKR